MQLFRCGTKHARSKRQNEDEERKKNCENSKLTFTLFQVQTRWTHKQSAIKPFLHSIVVHFSYSRLGFTHFYNMCQKHSRKCAHNIYISYYAAYGPGVTAIAAECLCTCAPLAQDAVHDGDTMLKLARCRVKPCGVFFAWMRNSTIYRGWRRRHTCLSIRTHAGKLCTMHMQK